MIAENFKTRIEALISQIEDIIEEMPQKGDKCEDCQKIYLTQTLNEFSYTVNGVEESDFQEDKDDDDD